MSETSEAAAEALAMLRDPRYICEQTIRTEEGNLAGVQIRRASIALRATLGDGQARKEAKVLDASEARILRRLKLARIALEQLDSREPREASAESM